MVIAACSPRQRFNPLTQFVNCAQRQEYHIPHAVAFELASHCLLGGWEIECFDRKLFQKTGLVRIPAFAHPRFQPWPWYAASCCFSSTSPWRRRPMKAAQRQGESGKRMCGTNLTFLRHDCLLHPPLNSVSRHCVTGPRASVDS